jgi:prophage maintenance system killer protein
LTEFGGRVAPEREPGLVEQVVAAAFQSFGGVDPHPQPFDKAAMLLRGIIQGHPFHDANKRTSFLTAYYYLRQMGYELIEPFSEDEVVAFCTRISAGQLRDVEEIARALPHWWKPAATP